MANDNTTLTAKVVVLEARAQAAEKHATQEQFNRDTLIGEVVEQVVEQFKQLE